MPKAACREAVLRDRDQVEEFIRQRGEFPDTMFYNLLMPGEQIVDVANASLADVEVVAVGELPEGSPRRASPVKPYAKIEVQARVSLAYWPAIRKGAGREAGTGAIISAILRGTRETVDR